MERQKFDLIHICKREEADDFVSVMLDVPNVKKIVWVAETASQVVLGINLEVANKQEVA